MLDSYQMIFLLSSVLGTYARYNFMQAFRENEPETKRKEIIVILLFYIVPNILYLIYDLPLMNLTVQIGFFILLGRSMGIKLKNALLATVMIVVIFATIESVVAFFTGYMNRSIFIEAEYQSLLGVATANITLLATSMAVKKRFNNVKKSIAVPIGYWLSIFLFPAISLFLLMIILSLNKDSRIIAILATMSILSINLIIFSVYDRLMVLYERQLDEIIIEHSNASYRKQLEMMQSSILNLESFRHDVNRHTSLMDTMIKDRRYDDLEEYIGEIRGNTENNLAIARTGNLTVDSIVNFEISTSDVPFERITFEAIDVPVRLKIKDYDLTSIISNVLSNALNAAEKVNSGKVDLQIEYTKGTLMIHLENDFDGYVIMDKDRFLTTSKDKGNHGYGLENVKRVLKKYNGEMRMDYDEHRFRTDIILYEKI